MVEREDKGMVLKMVVEEDPLACCCTVTLLEKRKATKQTVKVKSERCVRGKWGKKEFVIPFSAKRHISGVVDNGARVRMERQSHGVDAGLLGRAVPSRVASSVRERRQAGRARERLHTVARGRDLVQDPSSHSGGSCRQAADSDASRGEGGLGGADGHDGLPLLHHSFCDASRRPSL